MVPAETNREVAAHTLDEFISPVPERLKGFATKAAVSLLDDITREAMLCVMFSHHWYSSTVLTLKTFKQV